MTRAATPDEIADHDRDNRKHDPRPLDLTQRYAVAQLVGYCEGIVQSGVLGPDAELPLRLRIAAALAAFNMPSKTERAQGAA
jgi:hypothetical protein